MRFSITIAIFVASLISPVTLASNKASSEISPQIKESDIHLPALEKANELRKQGHYTQAIDVLLKSERNHHSSPQLSERIGRIYNALARKAIKEQSLKDAKIASESAFKKLNEALQVSPQGEFRQTILLQIYFNSVINYEIEKKQAHPQTSSIVNVVATREACLQATEELLSNKKSQKENSYRGRLLHEAGFLLTDRPEGKQADPGSMEKAISYYLEAKMLRTGSDKAMTSSRIIKVATNLGKFDLALDESAEAAGYYLKHRDLERITFLLADINYLLETIPQGSSHHNKKVEGLKELESS